MSIRTALTVYNLATLVVSLGRFEEAEALYRRALTTFSGTLGQEHPHTQICRESLDGLRGLGPN